MSSLCLRYLAYLPRIYIPTVTFIHVCRLLLTEFANFRLWPIRVDTRPLFPCEMRQCDWGIINTLSSSCRNRFPEKDNKSKVIIVCEAVAHMQCPKLWHKYMKNKRIWYFIPFYIARTHTFPIKTYVYVHLSMNKTKLSFDTLGETIS